MKTAMNTSFRKLISVMVVCAMLCTSLFMQKDTQAAGKIKLSKTSISMQTGKTVKLQLKNAGKKNSAKIKWSTSDKKVVALKKNKKNNSIVKLTAKSEGNANVKAKLSGKTYTCKVSVAGKDKVETMPVPTPQIVYVEVPPVSYSTSTPQIIYVEVTPEPAATSTPAPQGNLTYQSDVTADMTSASYWIDLCKEPDKVLATPDEIANINKLILNQKIAGMCDMLNLSETYNATSRKNSLASAIISDVKNGRVGSRDFYLDGVKVTDKDAFFNDIVNNISDAETQTEATIKYGLCTEAAEMKMAPVEGFIGWSATDTDEEFMDSRLNVNDPFIVEAVTADGKFYWGRSTNCTGWVLADHIAICSNKEEWKSMWTKTGEDILVVIDDQITLAPSAYDKALNKKELQFGSVLPLVPESEMPESIDARGTWYNYPVYIPTRDSEGKMVRSIALVSMNNKVSVGYLPLTQRNILNVAFNCLGNRYGWGGMMGLMDCSLYTRDIYKCFGYELPRNTTGQVKLPEQYVESLDGMTDDAKRAKIDSLEPGTLLMFSGHIMMYIGSVNNKQYVISDLGSASETAAVSEAVNVKGIFSVSINTLDVRRRNENTWLTSMIYAVRPW